MAGRSIAILAGLLLWGSGAGCSGDEADLRFARNFSLRGAWIPESQIPEEPQQQPFNTIWEVSRYYPGNVASGEHRRAADDLIERSFLAAEANGWFGHEKGLADGFQKMYRDNTHYVNEDFVLDGVVLDPERPEFLMYYPTLDGRKLVGFMFYTAALEARGPQIGGPLTLWHYHIWTEPACLLGGLLTVASPDEDGSCERGISSYRSPEMLHVWLVDHPGGPFATRMHIPEKLLPELLEKRLAERGL
jgi:hypothetical protein